jgi:hypothetical protein
MERAFNESYIHICESLAQGYQTRDAQDLISQFANKAHYFNTRYAQALYKMRANTQEFTDDDSVVLHELLVYSTIELMRALHIGNESRETTSAGAMANHMQHIEANLFQNMLTNFAVDGATNYRIYSACGLAISAGVDRVQDGPQSAFGGVDKESPEDHDKFGSRWFTCPKGHINYRKIAGLMEKRCTSCGTDVSCEAPKAKPQPKKALASKELRKIIFGSPTPKSPEVGSTKVAKSLFALAA